MPKANFIYEDGEARRFPLIQSGGEAVAAIGVSIAFSDDTVLDYNPDLTGDPMQRALTLHGAKAKIVDSYAGVKAKAEAMGLDELSAAKALAERVIANLVEGIWTTVADSAAWPQVVRDWGEALFNAMSEAGVAENFASSNGIEDVSASGFIDFYGELYSAANPPKDSGEDPDEDSKARLTKIRGHAAVKAARAEIVKKREMERAKKAKADAKTSDNAALSEL